MYNLKTMLFSNIILKVISFIIGCTFWYIISQTHTTSTWLEIPISFYGQPHNYTINAPETIRIHVCGKKKDLQLLSRENIALHINMQHLHSGNNPIPVSSTTLFLPDYINVIHYYPLPVIVTVTPVQSSVPC